jgi:TRAP-type C4-dicarboxylate transport system substrate-binding protein
MREALRTGQFDAQENAIVVIEGLHLNEVQKYVSLTSHTYDAAIFIASPDLMEDLSEAQQAALAECARTGCRVTRQVVDAADRDGIGRLKSVGMTVVEDVDLAAFRASAQPYLDSLAAKFGAEFVNRVRAAAT